MTSAVCDPDTSLNQNVIFSHAHSDSNDRFFSVCQSIRSFPSTKNSLQLLANFVQENSDRFNINHDFGYPPTCSLLHSCLGGEKTTSGWTVLNVAHIH